MFRLIKINRLSLGLFVKNLDKHLDIDLETTPKPTVSIFFILDGPKLEAQAILLAATLRFFNSDRYQIIAYASAEARKTIQRITFRVMKACDVEIRPLDPIRVGGRTAFNMNDCVKTWDMFQIGIDIRIGIRIQKNR
jgi:hypothetical protein